RSGFWKYVASSNSTGIDDFDRSHLEAPLSPFPLFEPVGLPDSGQSPQPKAPRESTCHGKLYPKSPKNASKATCKCPNTLKTGHLLRRFTDCSWLRAPTRPSS